MIDTNERLLVHEKNRFSCCKTLKYTMDNTIELFIEYQYSEFDLRHILSTLKDDSQKKAKLTLRFFYNEYPSFIQQ